MVNDMAAEPGTKHGGGGLVLVKGTVHQDWVLCECPGLKFSTLFVRSNDDSRTGDFTIEKFETRWIGVLTKESLAVSDSNRINQ